MEAEWMSDRAALRALMRHHPDWSQPELAQSLHRSLAWVKKWSKRLRLADGNDLDILRSRSRAPNHPPAPIAPAVVERILNIRDHPPANLARVPGPKAILYYLQHDTSLPDDLVLPRSTNTVWRILRDHQRILSPRIRTHTAFEDAKPLASWQCDFKDATSVPADPDGKRQHVVEVLNIVDVGTSILVDAQARADYTAETALETIAEILERNGIPERITLDRDPRWVGSQQGSDFPAALLRFLLCLGVQVTLCPPHRPDRNGFVERYHRTFDEECLQVVRPGDLEAVQQATAQFRQHYNWERPHQGRRCANQPPCVAAGEVQKRPGVPAMVEPDGWLKAMEGQVFRRRVGHDGTIAVNRQHYYVSSKEAGQIVGIRIDGSAKELVVERDGKEIKRLALRGVGGAALPYRAYVERMKGEARSEARRQAFVRQQMRLPL